MTVLINRLELDERPPPREARPEADREEVRETPERAALEPSKIVCLLRQAAERAARLRAH